MSNIQIFCLPLTLPTQHPLALSTAERLRAQGIKHEKSRQTFMLTKSALRIILGTYLECHPLSIDFQVNAYGKPYLLGHPVHFNVSHSGDYALIALSESPIGIDLELIREDFDWQEIAPLCCTASEWQWLNQFSTVEARQCFYALWTRKEAYTKARGLGLSLPLTSFTVLGCTQASTVLVDVEWSDGQAWQLPLLPLLSSYATAIATAIANPRLHIIAGLPYDVALQTASLEVSHCLYRSSTGVSHGYLIN